MGNMSLRPLNQIMQPAQPPQQQQPQQPVYQQQPQQPVYQQQPQQVPQSNTQQYALSDQSQLNAMRNNGRVEIVVQDANNGYQVISTDQLNIASVEQQNAQLGQELRMFDTNHDGWLVEDELKSAAVGQPVGGGEKVGTFERTVTGALGGGMFGGVTSKIPLVNKLHEAVGSKLGMGKGAVGMAVGALVGGTIAYFSGDKNDAGQQQYVDAYGYRQETQWQNNRLIKTVL